MLGLSPIGSLIHSTGRIDFTTGVLHGLCLKGKLNAGYLNDGLKASHFQAVHCNATYKVILGLETSLHGREAAFSPHVFLRHLFIIQNYFVVCDHKKVLNCFVCFTGSSWNIVMGMSLVHFPESASTKEECTKKSVFHLYNPMLPL